MSQLILVMTVQVVFTAFLYVLLTLARAPKVWGIGKRADGSNPWSELEPRISANLSNQFEWPIVFFIACLLLLQNGSEPTFAIWCAWAFVFGRFAHAAVQIFTKNIRLRGLIFTINFLAALCVWFSAVLPYTGASSS